VQAKGSPAPLPKPGNTLNTPGGMPASIASSARRMAVSGDFSEGFSSTLLPIASAGAIFHEAISIGKFHGTIAAITPSGSCVTRPSSSCPVGPTWIVDLVDRLAGPVHAAHGRGDIHRQRIIDGLPMSSDSSTASSSPCWSINWAKRIRRALAMHRAKRPTSVQSEKACARHGDRTIHVLGFAFGHVADHAAVDRADAIEGLAGRRVDVAPVDEGLVADLQRGGSRLPFGSALRLVHGIRKSVAYWR
jgi:hypothetical protein